MWEKNSDPSQISQKLCGINLILHRYLWEHQNIWELSTQKIEQNLGKVKTNLIYYFITVREELNSEKVVLKSNSFWINLSQNNSETKL